MNKTCGNFSFVLQVMITISVYLAVVFCSFIIESKIILLGTTLVGYMFIYSFQLYCFNSYFEHRFKYSKIKKILNILFSNIFIIGYSFLSLYLVLNGNKVILLIPIVGITIMMFLQQQLVVKKKFSQMYNVRLYVLFVSCLLIAGVFILNR